VEPRPGAVLAGAPAFAATNLDDLFLLVAWFAAGRYRTRGIILWQYLGIGALFAASALSSLGALAVPAEHLRWVGLVPIGIGLAMLARKAPSGETPVASGLLQVTAVTVANGADNLGVYIPLFAAAGAQAIGVFGAVFVVMLALWCAGSRWLVRHPAAGAPLRRWGPRAVPWVLIGVGLWILLS